MTKSFPGFSSLDAPDLKSLDWKILLNQADPYHAVGAFVLMQICKRWNNITCIDAFMDPDVKKITMDDVQELLTQKKYM